MTQDEIIEMARHVASTFGTRMCDENGDTHGQELYCMDIEDIVDTIKLVDAKATAKEREACAKEAEDSDHVVLGRGYHDQLGDADATARNIAAAIRARGEPTSRGEA